jgi:hypothetical protein
MQRAIMTMGLPSRLRILPLPLACRAYQGVNWFSACFALGLAEVRRWREWGPGSASGELMFRHRRRRSKIVYDDHLLFITAYKWGARSEINTNQPFSSHGSVIDTRRVLHRFDGAASTVWHFF